ncbi:MAG: glycosyltransferase family 1 protein [Planctomycetes bacterium]|nr:glycosyltransferase family 1 protein [Planctomycetota bacterium]
MTLRILEVLGYSCPGGAAESVLELCAAFTSRGAVVTIAAPPEPGFAERAAAAGARFVPVAMASRRDVASFLALTALIRRERFDVVHTHCRNADLHGALAARAAGCRAIVTHLRGLLVDGNGEPANGWIDRVHRAILRRLPRRIVAISEAVRARALERLALSPSRVVTIRNGIALARFAAPRRAPAEVRAELQVATDRPLVLAIGTLGRCKGQDLVLDAFAALRHDGVLALAGDGPDAAALRERAKRLGIADRVRFLGARTDITDLLHAADLFVHAARWEGFGRVVAEALAAGRPLVATRVGGIPEFVTDGANGLLVAPDSSEALATAMASLLEDRPRARALGRAGAEFAARELDAETTASGITRVLESAVAEACA